MEIVYTITLTEALKEYENNRIFREILQADYFVYIDNIYVLDTPKFVYHDKVNPPRLTDYARQNLDECALAFNEVTMFVSSGSTMHDGFPKSSNIGIKEKLLGDINFTKRGVSDNGKRTEIECSKNFKLESQKKELTEEIEAQLKVNKQMFESRLVQTKTCWQRIWEILEREHSTPSTFNKRTLLNDRYYYRARENHNSLPDIRTIMAIAAGYSLGLFETEDLLRLAGHAFSPTLPEHNVYIFIIVSMCGYNICAKNEILSQSGFKKLGSNSEQGAL